MTTKIICEKCGDVLRNGSPNSKTEHKICMPCVQKTYPQADPNSIKKPPSTSDHVENFLKKAKFDDMQKKLKDKNLEVEMETSLVDQDGKILFVLNFTIGKIKKFDIGLSKEQLQEFIADIDRVTLEQQLKK